MCLTNVFIAHHAAAASYTNILAHFGVEKHRDESDTLVWGCSATLQRCLRFCQSFCRHDGQALSQAFDKIVFHKEFSEMIKRILELDNADSLPL